MNSVTLYILNLSKEIDLLNDKLNAFFDKNLNSPWAGMAIFVVLFVFGCWAISSTSKK